MKESDPYTMIKVRLCNRSTHAFNICQRRATHYYYTGNRKQKVYVCGTCKEKIESMSHHKHKFFQVENGTQAAS